MFHKITEQEMKIQRVLGVAEYVKIVKISCNEDVYGKYLNQYGEILYRVHGLYHIKFENGNCSVFYPEEIKII